MKYKYYEANNKDNNNKILNMADKISVITVVYNDKENIRNTIESFFSQTWEKKEYIVIDGGSTDGTVDIIKQYSHKIDFWCSEKDNGIYDAMNKGIKNVTGDWIIILNSGDVFHSPNTLSEVMQKANLNRDDVIYGSSIEVNKEYKRMIEAGANPSKMEYAPVYRHGSSLIRTSVQKKNLYDLSKSANLGYALDWDMIYKVFKAGKKFEKVDVIIEEYKKEGTSNHNLKNLWYNYKITSEGKVRIKKINFLIKNIIKSLLVSSCFYSFIRSFLINYIPNDILTHIPFWSIRRRSLKLLKMRIGKGSFIMKNNYFINPNLVSIGEYSHINRNCTIDARGKVAIGNSVSISHNVSIITGSHDINSNNFIGIFKPIVIEDYVFLGIGCIILQGVKIGKGAVVCAGAIVTKDVKPYSIVAGIPAKVVGKRDTKLAYKCNGYIPLT